MSKTETDIPVGAAPALAAAVAPVLESIAWGPSLAHTQRCAADHFSPWMIEERWFRAAVEAVKNGSLKPRMMMEDDEDEEDERDPYSVVSGTAVIPIAGAIMKKRGKFAGASSVEVRHALRKAIHDDNVDSILLHIDSPGGTVAGTGDLAADVAAANRSKPVYAHIDDLGASAAYWIASQASRITANPTGEVGSIGTVLRLEDTSGFYAAKGIKVHVISTGKYKGAGYDGAPVTDEHLAMFQQEVDDLNEHFLEGVSKGRKMPIGKVRELADGRVHIASKAKAMGMIDDVMTLDQAFASMRKDLRSKGAETVAEPVAAVEPEHQTSAPEGVASLVTPAPAATTKESDMAENSATVTQAAPAQTPVAAAPAIVSQAELREREKAQLKAQTEQSHFENGRRAGVEEGRKIELKRLDEILAVCPDKAMALDAFRSGQTAPAVQLAYEARLRAENDAREREAEKDMEITRLKALVAAGGHSGVETSMIDLVDDTIQVDPKAQAEREWDQKPTVRKGFSSKERYVAVRTAELKGQFRIQKA